MRSADGRYRGRKPRGGLTAEKVILLSLVALAAILMLTMRASSVWTGMSYREQLYHALFVTEDWE